MNTYHRHHIDLGSVLDVTESVVYYVCRRVRRRRTQRGCSGRRRRRRHDRRHSRPRKREEAQKKAIKKERQKLQDDPARQEPLSVRSHVQLSELTIPHLCLCFLQTHSYFTDNESRRRPDDGGGGEALRPLGADQVQLGNRTGFYWADSLKLRVWFVVCRRWMKRWLLGVKSRVKRLWRTGEKHTLHPVCFKI